QTANWAPAAASSYLTLTTNYTNQVLAPNGVIKLGFRLRVAATVNQITTFTFNIVVTSTG
ncbi:hypothetical protein MUP77_18210, partial [Candidatus Bathyarchaeota archaeon]|nr:hypothetical protein [Candidatus Bathyarchaeota archaeon]